MLRAASPKGHAGVHRIYWRGKNSGITVSARGSPGLDSGRFPNFLRGPQSALLMRRFSNGTHMPVSRTEYNSISQTPSTGPPAPKRETRHQIQNMPGTWLVLTNVWPSKHE